VSAREAEVLSLVGEHLTNAQIAARLYISPRTAESHVASLLRKLGVADRRELAAVATRQAPGADGRSGHSDLPPPPPLPSPLTPFVGRAIERAALAEAVVRDRLVTAVGPGGVGKTRLAVAVAADVAAAFADGVWYVDLVPVTDPAAVDAAVATAVGLAEQRGGSPTQELVARFGPARPLLVLDNCEHVASGVATLVETVLTGCPHARILATSQAPLLLPFERTFPVAGMSTGREGDDAVSLFLDRATLSAGFDAPQGDEAAERITAICDALEGNALAIELAAARAPALGLDGLEAGLTDRLALLAGGSRADRRHRSLRSAVAWTEGLLAPIDRTVLRRCSVFAAPFTVGATVRVTAHGTVRPPQVTGALGRLAEHSLLEVVPRPDGTRYRMLESIRQYGQDRLRQTGEHDGVLSRHLGWCGSIVDTLRNAPRDPARFDDIAPDARAALTWAGSREDARPDAQRLAAGLGELAFLRGLPTEAQRRFEQAAELAAGDRAGAEALHRAAIVASCRLAGDDAARLHRAAAAAWVRAGDRHAGALDLLRAAEFFNRFAGILTDLPPEGEAARLSAEAAALGGDDEAVAVATVVATRAGTAAGEIANIVERAGRTGDRRLHSAALDWLVSSHLKRGEPVEACAVADRRLEVLAPTTDDLEVAFEQYDALHTATLVNVGAGRLRAARRLVERRTELPFLQEEDELVNVWLVVVSALAGDWEDVLALDDHRYASLVRGRRMPVMESALAPSTVAMVHALRGDDDRRRRWEAIADAVVDAHPQQRAETAGYGPVLAATIDLHRGDEDGAAARLSADPDELATSRSGVWKPWYAAVWAEAGVAAGVPDARSRVDRARALARGNPVAAAIVERAAVLADEDADATQLLAVAAAVDAAGCRYQCARTLVLAGGPSAEDAERILSAMGVTPMAVPKSSHRRTESP
jgi:predicted ATPase/DNA-binding CsgD family transcriptional regulator